jgi:hypothetical protein
MLAAPTFPHERPPVTTIIPTPAVDPDKVDRLSHEVADAVAASTQPGPKVVVGTPAHAPGPAPAPATTPAPAPEPAPTPAPAPSVSVNIGKP